MKAVADRRLRDLRDKGLRITQHQILERTAGEKFALRLIARHFQSVARALNDRSPDCRVPAKECSEPDHPLISRNTDLCDLSRLGLIYQGNDRGRWEIDVRDPLARFVQNCTKRELGRLEVRSDPCQ